jgi:hypothetical protein
MRFAIKNDAVLKPNCPQPTISISLDLGIILKTGGTGNDKRLIVLAIVL